jgi:hypothetical protein
MWLNDLQQDHNEDLCFTHHRKREARVAQAGRLPQ